MDLAAKYDEVLAANTDLNNALMQEAVKYDALEAAMEEMDGQLSSEQRKEREMNDGF